MPVPETSKSNASTLTTASENVTRHVRLSAFVDGDAGICRLIDVTVGAEFASIIVPAAVMAWLSRVALTGLDSVTVNVSLVSITLSAAVCTSKFAVNPPAAIVTASLVFAVKSAASAVSA